MSVVDEQAVVLTLVLALASAGCVWTKVAIITVRNETTSDVAVHPQLRGHTGFDEPPVALKPQQEEVMVKYEESRWHAKPVTDFVLGLRLVTPHTCVRALDGGAVERAAERSASHRRWTIRLTPAVLQSSGCVPGSH